MNDILRDLLLNGFMIYPKNGKFIVKKEAVPSNLTVSKEAEYNSYELAVEAAESMLSTPKLTDWTVIVRYNRGLGVEYKNLPDVRAENREQAKVFAERMAEHLLADSKVSEVKVRLKI